MKIIKGEKIKEKGKKENILKKHLRTMAFGEIVVDLLLIALGVFYALNPEISINLTCKTIGLVICLSSVYAVIKYLFDDAIFFYRYDLIYGVLGLILGLVIFTKPIETRALFMIGLAIWFIITSIRKLLITYMLYKYKDDTSIYSLSLSVIILLLGILIIFNPLKATIAFSTLCGLTLIFYAAMNISHMVMIIQYSKKFIKYFEN